MGESIDESDDARVVGNGELDAVAVKTDWNVALCLHLDYPGMRMLIVGR